MISESAGGGRPRRPQHAGRQRAAKRRATWRRRGTVLLFLSPWIVGFSVFFGYPLVMSAYLSFTTYDLICAPRWVGLGNYRPLFNDDPEIWTAVKNTPCGSSRCSSRCRCCSRSACDDVLPREDRRRLLRTVFYLPALVPPVAATLGFVYILNPATGPVNTILDKLGIGGRSGSTTRPGRSRR